MISATRAQRRQLDRENSKRPVVLKEVQRSEWPHNQDDRLSRVWRSRDFLVQEFSEQSPVLVRLSICRTSISGNRWQDGISWDDLQSLKKQCGYGDHDAIEIYPSERDVVCVANMRHLWVMSAKIPFAWRN